MQMCTLLLLHRKYCHSEHVSADASLDAAGGSKATFTADVSLHASQSLQDAANRIEQHSTATIARILCSAAKASHYTPAVEYLAGSRRLADGLQTLSWGSLRAFLFALAKLDCRPANVWDPLEAAVSSKGAVSCHVLYSLVQICLFQRLNLACCTMDILTRRLTEPQ